MTVSRRNIGKVGIANGSLPVPLGRGVDRFLKFKRSLLVIAVSVNLSISEMISLGLAAAYL